MVPAHEASGRPDPQDPAPGGARGDGGRRSAAAAEGRASMVPGGGGALRNRAAVAAALLLAMAGRCACSGDAADGSKEEPGGSAGAHGAIQGFPPNTKYTVITHAVARPKYQEEFLVMVNHEKRAFECVLPAAKVQPPKEEAQESAAAAKKAASAPSLDSFLHPLSGRCFLRNEGYWSFEICHRKKIRQFHEVDSKRGVGPVAVEYSLGDFDKVEETLTDGGVVSHKYEGGTRCDETKAPRHAVVQYSCDPASDNHIKWIKEVATCSYIIMFHSPLLCSHPSVKKAPKPKTLVADYLSGLEGSCFYRVEGWWTYEFCYLKNVKQFHQENSVSTAEFSLGLFNKKAAVQAPQDANEVEIDEGSKHSIPYYRQTYAGGTKCDVTGQPRQVDVHFKCATDSLNVIASIKEKSTCKYVLEFFTPLICSHPAFQATQDPHHTIECYPAEPEEPE